MKQNLIDDYTTFYAKRSEFSSADRHEKTSQLPDPTLQKNYLDPIKIPNRPAGPVKRYPFDPNNTSLSLVYLAIIDMLTTAAQESYPYHIPNVVSNDELYGSDSKFIAEIDTLCSQCVDLMLFQLKLLGDNGHLRLQSNLALELFVNGCKVNFTVLYCRLSNDGRK